MTEVEHHTPEHHELVAAGLLRGREILSADEMSGPQYGTPTRYDLDVAAAHIALARSMRAGQLTRAVENASKRVGAALELAGRVRR